MGVLASEELNVGTYNYSWDTPNLTSGVYFYKLQAGDPSTSSEQRFVETKKMVLLR